VFLDVYYVYVVV